MVLPDLKDLKDLKEIRGRLDQPVVFPLIQSN
jgi:hypothetical protein